MFRRKFKKVFKEEALRKVRGGTPLVEVARDCRVDPAILRRWQKELDNFGARAFGGYGTNRHACAEPRSRSITLHVSPDEFDALKITASAAGSRSLAEFARFRMFRETGEPPPEQVETVLEELDALARKLTQRLTK